MNELWQRLTPRARDRVDKALLEGGLLSATLVLRTECVLDPAPGLYEAQETVIHRQHQLIDQGGLEEEPPKRLDVSGGDPA